MDKKTYKSWITGSHITKTIWMGIAGLLLVSNVLLSFFVVTADTSEKTIVTPPHFEKPFSVTANEVSPEYTEQMARYFAYLLLTYQPNTAEAQFQDVVRYAHPSVHSGMQTNFMLDVERIRRNNISSVFYPMGIHVSDTVATVRGEQAVFIGSQLVNKREMVYRFEFVYDGGQFSFISYNELKKGSDGTFQPVAPDKGVLVEVSEEAGEVVNDEQ